MIISAKLIRKPRLRWLCENCHALPIAPCVRLFGAADEHDKPYAIRICIECARNAKDSKIDAAISALAGAA